MKILFSNIFILLLWSLSFGQEDIRFYGKVISKSGFVYNANVINQGKYKGTVTDFNGDFSLYVQANDTINFSSIGYKGFSYIIPDTLNSKDYRVILNMIEDTVMIGETIITPWPINRTQLKKAFLAEEKKEKETITTYAGFREIEGDPTEPNPTILNPISFIANLFSKKRIQQKKIEKYRRIINEGKSP